MPAWLRFLPHAGVAFIAAAVAWHLAGWVNEMQVDRLNREHATAMDAAIKAERETCAAQKATTKEVSDAYQKKIRDINARHADAVHRLLQHEAGKCVCPADAAPGHDAAAGSDAVYCPGDGINGVDRLGRAAAAERQAQQLIACQDYVTRITE